MTIDFATDMENIKAERATAMSGVIIRNGSVSDIPDEELLRRAVHNARCHKSRGKHMRWVAVSDVFLLGSTYSYELCRRFGVDPDGLVAPR